MINRIYCQPEVLRGNLLAIIIKSSKNIINILKIILLTSNMLIIEVYTMVLKYGKILNSQRKDLG